MKDKLLRKLCPSVPLLARTPIATLLDGADFFLRRSRAEWSVLPPASLRLRIGVGNRILLNHDRFLRSGRQFIDDLVRRGYLTPASRVVELGCGCGRNSLALLESLGEDGWYLGQDVDRVMVKWCTERLSRPNFCFHHADLFSAVYNPRGRPMSGYRLPAEDGTATLVFATSVFSHVLHQDLRHYLAECARILAPGGRFLGSFFLLEHIGSRLGDRWTFPHRAEHCRIESLEYPEAAVAYELPTVQRALVEAGLQLAEVYNESGDQQCVVAVKRALP